MYCNDVFEHYLFSAPEPKAQVHYCDHALSVVRPSVRPSLTFHILDFSSKSAARNSTKLDRKQDLNVLYQVCVFRADRKKQDGRPGLWLAETFSTSPLKPLNRIQRNLTGSKISTSSTKFVFFGPLGKTRWPPWPLIGWDIFNFSSETAEWNLTKLDRKQDLNVRYQVCVFRADRKNKMAALASDWLRSHSHCEKNRVIDMSVWKFGNWLRDCSLIIGDISYIIGKGFSIAIKPYSSRPKK